MHCNVHRIRCIIVSTAMRFGGNDTGHILIANDLQQTGSVDLGNVLLDADRIQEHGGDDVFFIDSCQSSHSIEVIGTLLLKRMSLAVPSPWTT